MGELFLELLNRSITAGWFLLAVIVARLVFPKFPRWIICFLWGAAAVRLICPFSIESPFSVLQSAKPVRDSAVVEGKVRKWIPSIDSHLAVVEHTVNPMLADTFAYQESDSAAPLQVAAYVAGMVWVCGAVLLVLYAAASMGRLYRLVREAVCVKDNFYICDAVASPFILGIVRPRVYLPSALSEKEMGCIAAHESAHLQRKDHWWKLLGYCLACIYWFHPVCWAAYAMFCKDIELACDERAVKEMSFDEKKEYARVLLSHTGKKSLRMGCPLAFGEAGVKERVKSVLHYKKPKLWMTLAAAAGCVVLAACFLTNPVQGEEKDSAASREKPEKLYDQPQTEKSEKLYDQPQIEKPEKLYDQPQAEKPVKLYSQPQAGKVCIAVQPSEVREYATYYYIPTGTKQDRLAAQVKAQQRKGKSGGVRFNGQKETGWRIIWQDIEMTGLEVGYLYGSYYDEKEGLLEFLEKAPRLCASVQRMLEEDIGYQAYDISQIKDVVSAKLDVKSMSTGWKRYSQTITDPQVLQKLEQWFSQAEYIFGGADCGNQCACLELTMKNAETVKLSVATDSCPNVTVNGVAYDYRPAPDWDNREFFAYFNEIPWEP